jgi:hypothetical protein
VERDRRRSKKIIPIGGSKFGRLRKGGLATP